MHYLCTESELVRSFITAPDAYASGGGRFTEPIGRIELAISLPSETKPSPTSVNQAV